MHLKCLLDLKDTQQGNFKSVMWHFIKDRDHAFWGKTEC